MYYFFYIPVGTEASVRRTPWGTILLAFANIWSFLLFQLAAGLEPEFYRLTLRAGEPSVATAVTSSFLHSGWLHLASNLIYFGIFGPPVESRIGTVRFLFAYLGCAGLSNLSQAAWVLRAAPDLASVPIMGSSGAIAGIMGLFLVRLYFVKLRFAALTMLFLQGVARGSRFALPAVAAIALWFLLQVVYQLVEPTAGTAYVSHLAGLGFGAALGLLMGLAGEGRMERRIIIGNRYAERGEWFAALGEYDAYLARHPADPDVLIQAARVHRVTHQTARSMDRFREAIGRLLRSGEVSEACDAYDEMKRLLGDVAIPPADELRVARGFEEAGRPTDASRAYEAYGRHHPDAPAAWTALLKCADIERARLNNPGRAQYICSEILRRTPPPEIERMARERLLKIEEALALQRGAA
ncbi:MAG: rhomboid family intramembrane serine protease [Candidatus Latescibacteria bacterium]|nr:rhomboid family intramembrane serine protease [Candidatus Latescibacterota bacterium]